MESFGFKQSTNKLLSELLNKTNIMGNFTVEPQGTIMPSLVQAIDATISSTNTTFSQQHPNVETRASLTGISYTSTIIVTLFLCIVIFMSVFGNSLALAAFFVSRELRKITYYFIANLCISDLTVAVLSMPFWISYVLTGWPDNQSGAIYTFWICLDIFCGSWSIMSLAMISIERYICIVYSLHYPVYVTKARAFAMVAFVLFYSTLASMLGFLQTLEIAGGMSITIFVAVYVVPVLIKIYTYACIYKEARAQKKFMSMDLKTRKRFEEERKLYSSDGGRGSKTKKSSDAHSTAETAHSIDVNCNDACKKSSNGKHQQDGRSTPTCKKAKKHKVKVNLHKKRRERSCKSAEENHAMIGMRKQDSTPANSAAAAVQHETEFQGNETSTLTGICYESEEGMSGERTSLVSELSKECSDNGASDEPRPTEAAALIKPARCAPENSPSTSSAVHCITVEEPPVTKEIRKGKQERSPMSQSSSQSRSKRFFKSDSLAEIKNKSILRFRRFQRELREAKIIGFIVGTFLVSWTPFMLVVVLSSLNVPVSMDVVMATKCLHYANSAINPILYVLLNRIFRKSVRKVLVKAGILHRRNRNDYF